MTDERILRVGVQTQEAEANLDRLSGKFHTTAASAKVLEASSGKLKRGFHELVQGARSAASMMAGFGGTLALGAAIKQVLDLENAFDSLSGVGGVVGRELQVYMTEVRKMSEVVGLPQKELAESLKLVEQAGFEGAEALEVLQAAAMANVAGLGETKLVVDAVTSAINAYGRENLKAEQATAIFIMAAREGKVDLQQFEAGIGKILPTAASLGISLAEVSATMAAMSRVGVDGRVAISGLTSIFETLSSPTETMKKGLKEVGLTVGELNNSLKNNGIIDTLVLLESSIGDNNNAMEKIFPNIKGMNILLSLVGDHSTEAKEITKQLAAETGGTLAKAFKDGGGKSLEFDVAVVKLNNSLMDAATDILPAAIYLVEKFGSVVKGTVGRVKNFAEAMAAAFTDESADPLANITATVDRLEQKLRAMTGPAAKEFFEFKGLDSSQMAKAIAETARVLEGARAEQRRLMSEAMDGIITEMGDKSVAEFRKMQQHLLNKSEFFGIGTLLFNISQEDVAKARTTIELIDKWEEELYRRRQTRANAGIIERGVPSALALEPSETVGPPKPEDKSPFSIGDEDKRSLESLIEKYDQFGGALKALKKEADLLNGGVKAGEVSAKSAASAYEGMLLNISSLAASSADFNKVAQQSVTITNLLDEAVARSKLSIDGQAAGYSVVITNMVAAATASGDFEKSLKNTATATNFVSAALAKNAASADLAAISTRTLFENLAEAAVKSGSFKVAVVSANQVLTAMEAAVKAGNLEAHVAIGIYESLGKALNELSPAQKALEERQEHWNTLLSGSVTPLEEYEKKLQDLSRAAQALLAAGEDKEAVFRNLREGVQQAADAYSDSLNKLTPQQEKFQAAIERVGDASANAFSSMIQGANSFKDVLNGLLSSILDVITQLLILEPLRNSITMGLGSFFGIPSGTAGGNPSGGPVAYAAGGGRLRSLRTYQVGEEGPELFIPSAAGEEARLLGVGGPEHITAPPEGGVVLSNRETRQILDEFTRARKRRDEDSNRAAGGPIRSIDGSVSQTSRASLFPKQPVSSSEGSNTQINIHNYSGAEAKVEKRKQPNGDDVYDIVIGAVTRDIDNKGSVSKAVNRSGKINRR